MGNICGFFGTIYQLLDKYFAPVVNLYARLFVALIFWRSSMVAIQDMNVTAYLFEHEFNITVIDPVVGSYLSTGIELVGCVLLAFGLFSRIAAFALLAITLLIQYTYMSIEVHVYWAIILAWVVASGPGSLSLDYLFKRRCCRR